jgi:sterol desaturase/sphingolipid hydroxylase (fatty acid hydroxylase superfamily)
MVMRAKNCVELVAYPAVCGSALIGYQWMVAGGTPPEVSAYVAVAVAFVAIVLHEILLPERVEWRPRRSEIANDLLFLVTVHMLMPRFLGLLTALGLAALTTHWGIASEGLWPRQWPDWAQVALLAVTAEFPRYWVHRLSHNWGPLWRFHAVHHAPSILYSLNVARFHPVDRVLQFVVEVSPFILLGVTPEVLSFYFVFYAVTGFYQHSNSRVRLGVFNWIIAGPELHRWHHSVRPEESNSNYGNKLIVWDVVFGTRLLPPDRVVGRLGLLDRAYPTGFIQQMLAPFQRSGSGQ